MRQRDARRSGGHRGQPDQEGSYLDALTKAYAVVLDAAGVREDSYLDLVNTPKRVAKMMANELLSSYAPGADEKLVAGFTTFPANGKQEMVVEVGIPFVSLCAHHMIPFVGKASVGYIPGERIVGLSKIPRAVDFFSHKLQIQERMTSEVADFMVEHLQPLGVIVYVEAEHLCMSARGVRKPGVVTVTSALRGVAAEAHVKAEFMAIISRQTR